MEQERDSREIQPLTYAERRANLVAMIDDYRSDITYSGYAEYLESELRKLDQEQNPEVA